MRSAEHDSDITGVVQQIEQTEDRLAAAVEALAFKKAHLKDEVIGIAEEKADRLLGKAEETKDHLVARIGDKIPDRREVKAIATSVAAKAGERLPEVKEAASEAAGNVVDSVARAGETAVTKLRQVHGNPTQENNEAPD